MQSETEIWKDGRVSISRLFQSTVGDLKIDKRKEHLLVGN